MKLQMKAEVKNVSWEYVPYDANGLWAYILKQGRDKEQKKLHCIPIVKAASVQHACLYSEKMINKTGMEPLFYYEPFYTL